MLLTRSRKSIILLLITLFLRSLHVQTMKFCLINSDNPPEQANSITKISSPRKQKQIDLKNELRSYKPHFINSYSYADPLSPLIYYGQVHGDKPIFLYRDNPSPQESTTQQLFLVNGQSFTPASARNLLLRKNVETTRFMLSFQFQNLYLDRNISHKIYLTQMQNYYLFMIQYEYINKRSQPQKPITIKKKAYQLFFVEEKKNQIQNLQTLKENDLQISIRQQSMNDNHETWKLAAGLRWQQNLKSQNAGKSGKGQIYKGVVMQIQFINPDKLHRLQIHLKEIKTQISSQLSIQFIAQNLGQRMQNSKIPQIQYLVQETCGQASFNKLISGLSYEYGDLKLKNGTQDLYNDPLQLLSFSPSKTTFPWGFLWDDGFHCQIAIRNNQELTKEILKSWLDTIVVGGWIPREQNRGKQREHLCNCPNFMYKDVRDGNPPTLILALQYLQRNQKLTLDVFPKQYWQKLKKWYDWYVVTLQDSQSQMLFKWYDSIKNGQGSLTSGMDDFPRPSSSKGHIDLQCWMYFFTRFMYQTADLYQDSESKKIYERNLFKIRIKMKEFIDPTDHVLKDFDIKGSFAGSHLGYPSILPIAFGILEESSQQFAATMRMIKNDLDTNHGLSSISIHDPHYFEKDAYWRGPVWINMNYLLLKGLKLYYPNTQVQFYNKLRGDLLKMICGNYQKSGFFYQNYVNGTGHGAHPFNGWTSVVAIIQTEDY